MAAPVRRAGRGRLPDGAAVIWAVAEGTQGRRWREVVARDGTVVHSLLLETFPDRRFAHLELSTRAGLLTLHPEGDRTLHGNAVTADGVRHVIGLPWPDKAVVLVEDSPVAGAAAARALEARAGGGQIPTVRIPADLSVVAEDVPAAAVAPELDDDGLPILADGESWPLELEAAETLPSGEPPAP